MAGLALSMLLASLGASIAAVALPTLSSVFSAPMSSVQWVALAYLLAMTVAIVVAGRLGDILGHRRVLLLGLTLYAGASVLCGLSPTLGALIAARAVQGVGAAILMALSVSMVRDAVPAEKTGAAMGMLGTMSAIGTTLGPSIGGVLIAGLGWQAAFLVLTPLCLAAMALVARSLPPANPAGSRNKARFDVLGTVILSLTLTAYAAAMTVGDTVFGPFNAICLTAAGLGLGIFVRVQARVAAPLVPLTVFRSVALAAALFMNLLVSTVMMATMVVGPFYLAFGLGLSEALVGLVMAVGPLVASLTGIPAGSVTDRFGASTVLAVGLWQMAIGLACLAFLPPAFGVIGYILAMVLLTPGFQLFLAANNTAVMVAARDDQRGMISGLLGLSRNVGFVSGASFMGALFAAAVGRADVATASPHAIASAFTITFLVAVGLILLSLVVAYADRKAAAKQPQDP